jgi:hypothetical protein
MNIPQAPNEILEALWHYHANQEDYSEISVKSAARGIAAVRGLDARLLEAYLEGYLAGQSAAETATRLRIRALVDLVTDLADAARVCTGVLQQPTLSALVDTEDEVQSLMEAI